ncbi:NADH-quinone oxidoreductase subunit F [Candidatus Fermentibacteria bacterium]|nr:MAG: NADH-quinone oxidoreductase subunit F [Candidatus Fermentibacteria bacterium]
MVNPVLLIAVPLGLAFMVPLIDSASRKLTRFVPVAALLFNLILCIRLIPAVLENPIVINLGGFTPPFGINLFVGPLGLLFAGLISLAGLVVSIYSLSYIKNGPVVKYHMLYMLLLTGATGVVLTGDLFNLFVFFEILCISSYALVAYHGDRAGIESSIKYLIQGTVGSGLLLIGIGFIYGIFGTLNMADIAMKIATVEQSTLFVPMILMVAGLGVESAIFPLNAWLPDAHSSAPSSISAILSGIAIEVGLYAVARIVFTVFGISDIYLFFAFLGILTLLIGEMCAFAQSNIKRMLAYSSIGQIGLILFALALATNNTVTGGLFQLVNHTFSKGLLFLSAGYMIYRSGSMEISSLNGMGKRMPLTSLAFTVGAFSLVGLPPFAGFPGKFLIVSGALLKGEMVINILVGLVLLSTVIEGTYFFRVIQALYFKDGNGEQRKQAPATAVTAMIALMILIVALGVYPKFLADFLSSASSDLLDKMSYVGSVLK